MSVPPMDPEAPSFSVPVSLESAEMYFTPIDGSVPRFNSGMVSMQALFNGMSHETNDSKEHCNDMEKTVQIMRGDFEYMRAQQRSAEENTFLLEMNAMLKQQLNAEMQAAAAHSNILTKQREEALEIRGLLQRAIVDLSIIHVEICANVIGGCAHLQDSVNDKVFNHLRYCCHFTHFTPFWTTITDIVQRCNDTRATRWIPLRYMPEKAWKDIDLTRQWQRLNEADANPRGSDARGQVQYTPPPTPASVGDIVYPELMPQ